MKFGDLLCYPDDQGVGQQIVFMHLAVVEHGGREYQEVMVLRTLPEDDQWETGTILTGGIEEFVPYQKRIIVRWMGEDITDKMSFAEYDLIRSNARHPSEIEWDGQKVVNRT